MATDISIETNEIEVGSDLTQPVDPKNGTVISVVDSVDPKAGTGIPVTSPTDPKQQIDISGAIEAPTDDLKTV